MCQPRKDARALYAERNRPSRVIPTRDDASKQWLDDPAAVIHRLYPVVRGRKGRNLRKAILKRLGKLSNREAD
jgi:hypothetical protein